MFPLYQITEILPSLGLWHKANYSCKKFSPMIYRLATIHLWQTTDRRTDRQMDDNHANSSNDTWVLGPWFILHPTGHIGPNSDAIRVCQELPPLLLPRWTPSFVSFCWLCSSSSLLVDLVLSYILVAYLPIQCLLWYALTVHTQNMSKPA